MDDLISRKAAIDAIWDGINMDIYTREVKECLEALPSVTPPQKMGKWIAVENEEMKTVGYYCSKCDLPMETEQRTKFCPNCGQPKIESKEP